MRPIAVLCLVLMAWPASAKPLTDAEVKQAIIREDLARYFGPCPCPYNIMRSGRRCGSWSAYSKPGGAEPICYPEQILPDHVRAYRQAHAGQGDRQ